MPSTTVTIPAGESLSSNDVDLSGALALMIQTPAEWTGGNLTFQMSVDGTNWADLFTMLGREKTVPVVTSAIVPIDIADLPKAGTWRLKLRSGTRDYPVVQSADRAFVVTVAT